MALAGTSLEAAQALAPLPPAEPCSGHISSVPETRFISHRMKSSFGNHPNLLLARLCGHCSSSAQKLHPTPNSDMPNSPLVRNWKNKLRSWLKLIFGDSPTIPRLKHATGFPGSLPVQASPRSSYLELMVQDEESPAASDPAKLLGSQP